MVVVVVGAWFHVTLSTEGISNITTRDICILITLWRGGTGSGASEKTEGREKVSPTARPSVQAGITAGPECAAPNARDNGTCTHTHTHRGDKNTFKHDFMCFGTQDGPFGAAGG